MNHDDKGNLYKKAVNLRTESSRRLYYVTVVVGSMAADRKEWWLNSR